MRNAGTNEATARDWLLADEPLQFCFRCLTECAGPATCGQDAAEDDESEEE